MDFVKEVYDWAVGFFGVADISKIIHSGNYSSLRTYKGIVAVIGPLFPVILVVEIFVALLYRKLKLIDYKIPFFSYVLNAVVGRFISIAAIAYCIGLFEKHAIFKTSFTWYWFLYGYVVWEFGHFLYHYFGHKVRLFWCLHSTHHAPQNMNLSISFAHFFLEGPYADVIRTTTCILLGVSPPLLFAIMFIDGSWGGFIHLGETMSKTGKFGPLHKYILTPMHHRVHHGRNPLYMDTNFCNLLNIWDRVFRTYQPINPDIPVEYGITRKMVPNSFMDAYFGEFVALAKDIARAPGIKNKFLYIIMPPGWSHTGEHKTASKVRGDFLKSLKRS
ncbi:MAG TPA: sterol desaturase family protein [Puia sp.]|jgi:sterol desaturase/sphingolipid hydroxylase (fatty acid hydroxylase superfamily)